MYIYTTSAPARYVGVLLMYNKLSALFGAASSPLPVLSICISVAFAPTNPNHSPLYIWRTCILNPLSLWRTRILNPLSHTVFPMRGREDPSPIAVQHPCSPPLPHLRDSTPRHHMHQEVIAVIHYAVTNTNTNTNTNTVIY
jgi:hypothetical protein